MQHFNRTSSFPIGGRRGFTLIEVMIVLIIIAVLATIAYPSYTRYLIQARRADGQAALLQTAAFLQKYYSQCGAYPTSINTGGPVTACNGGLGIGANSPDRHYVLRLDTVAGPPPTSVPNMGFILYADPDPASSQVNDTECATLTLDNAGIKRATGTYSATPERCWKR